MVSGVSGPLKILSNATHHPLVLLLSSFCPPKFDVTLKITIEFMIDHY
jgi:hypothetical protein